MLMSPLSFGEGSTKAFDLARQQPLLRTQEHMAMLVWKERD
jgi:hypothetical protein